MEIDSTLYLDADCELSHWKRFIKNQNSAKFQGFVLVLEKCANPQLPHTASALRKAGDAHCQANCCHFSQSLHFHSATRGCSRGATPLHCSRDTRWACFHSWLSHNTFLRRGWSTWVQEYPLSLLFCMTKCPENTQGMCGVKCLYQ